MIRSRLIANLIWTVLVIVSLLDEVVSYHDGRNNIPQNFDYAAYVEKYGKSHDNIETLARASLFYARTLGIVKANMQYIAHKTGYYLQQNQYTDMTHQEVEQNLVNKGIDLVPVVGSDMYPDMPADEFAQVINEDDSTEGYSASALSDLTTQKTAVDFLSHEETSSVDPHEMVREIVEHPEDAKRLARTLELGKARKTDLSLQSFRDANNIDYRPIVEPENSRYDPSLVPSLVWSDDIDRQNRLFANLLMDDFANHLEPYPEPFVPTKKVLSHDTSDYSGSVLSDLFESVKSIYNYVAGDDVRSYEEAEDNDVEMIDAADEAKNDIVDVEMTDAEETGRAPKVNPKKQGRELIFDVDWRRTGCISKPKSQSDCNACYAFATLDLMEFFYCRQKKVSTEFSVQYVIDCGRKSNLNGCQGGKLTNVGLFIRAHGLQLNAAYPYTALEGECPYNEKSDEEDKSWAFKPQISGWQIFPSIKAWYKWLPARPIIVGINMPSDFLAYGGGVHDGSDCAPHMVHAMLLVGSGKENGEPFWLLKNSFGDNWGETGYFRLSKKAPIRCFYSAVVAKVEFLK